MNLLTVKTRRYLNLMAFSSSESDDEVEMQGLVICDDKSVSLPDNTVLLTLLSESHFNWFESVEKVVWLITIPAQQVH